jgi:hypothetical protein
MGNTPNIAVLCSGLSGRKAVHIQVKTFSPGKSTCTVGSEAERNFGANFFWVLAGIPKSGQEAPFVYFIIPSETMAQKVHKALMPFLGLPGKKGEPRNDNGVRTVPLPPRTSCIGWSIEPFRDRWDLITDRLK